MSGLNAVRKRQTEKSGAFVKEIVKILWCREDMYYFTYVDKCSRGQERWYVS